MRGDHGLHVLLVLVGTDLRHLAVGVLDVVVAPGHLVVLHLGDAPGVQVALDLAGLGVHQGTLDAVRITHVTLAAGTVGDPDGTRVRVEGLRTVAVFQTVGRALVRGLDRRTFRVTAVAHDTAFRVAIGCTDRLDLQHHGRGIVTDIFNSVVTAQTAGLAGRRRLGDGGEAGTGYQQQSQEREYSSHRYSPLINQRRRPARRANSFDEEAGSMPRFTGTAIRLIWLKSVLNKTVNSTGYCADGSAAKPVPRAPTTESAVGQRTLCSINGNAQRTIERIVQ